MNIFVIGDLHLYHRNIHEYQGRSHGFEEQIRLNWNKAVRPNDVVFVLGDVIFGSNKEENLLLFMKSLLGKKILTIGNHDHESLEFYMSNGFEFACHSFVYGDIAFSHAPLTPLPYQNLEKHDKQVRLNIHAHFHKITHRTPKEHEDKDAFKDRYYDYQYYKKNREKYHLIQIEDTLAPFLLRDILKEHESITEG